MRIYEFAKEHGLSSKQATDLLKDGGFDVGSHMSALTDDARAFLLKHLKKSTASRKPSPAPKRAARAKKPASVPLVSKSASARVGTRTQPSSPSVAPQPAQSATRTPPPARPAAKRAPSTSQDRRPQGRRSSSRSGGKKNYKLRKAEARRAQAPIPEVVTQIVVTKNLPLNEVATMMGKSSGEVILALLRKGIVCNRNQVLSVDTISSLARDFGLTVLRPEAEEAREGLLKGSAGRAVGRWPIVVVMGHVDHGKTTLLDYIRKHNVAAREKGGITQHLGAYEVDSTRGKIVFLDTPGHAAFSYMRERGARVTDLVVLMVAADDGIKPQTIEAINQAQQADVPIIVGINKIDKVANRTTAVETIKRQLSEHDLMPEDWGGDTICVPLSAKTGEGVDDLLDMIVLQAEMAELKANPSAASQAFILESKLERGLGPVATVISLDGTLKRGDYFVCGSSTGRVRLLIDSAGKRIEKAGPSIPVQVVGFDKFVSLGDWLKVVSFKEYARAKSSKRGPTSQMVRPPARMSIGESKEEERATINILLKTDMQGSAQAVKDSLAKIGKKHKEVPASFVVIKSGIGDISESDVLFAADTGAMIVGLHVKPEKNAVSVAKEKSVKVWTDAIIYKLLERLEDHLLTYRKAKVTVKKVAEAEVRKVFDVKGLGVIAGCYVKEGVITRDCKVVCMRGSEKIGEGKIKSLQRERKTVKEVHSGFECGFILENFGDWQEGDIAEIYQEKIEKPSART